jgi:hypothetical protein
VKPLPTLIVCVLVLLAESATFSTAGAQTRPTRMELGASGQSIMWVGNSFFYYNNSLHNHFGNMVRAADPKARIRGTSITISGSGIEWHDLESYFRPAAIGRYSFVGDNEIVFNKPGRQYDTVILMDCSQCPIHPQLKSTFHEFAKKHSDAIRQYGARPAFFMSWAYKDKPEMTQQLADEYTRAGNANDALVIPAGLAFAEAVEKRPALELYQPDKRHPSLAGTSLATATTYAALYRKSPAANTYLAGLDAATAQFLQGVAWETVQEYYRNGG